MLAQMRRPPNLITALRFVSIPTLWTFAFLERPLLIGIGLIIAGVSDSLDGYLARRMNQVSSFGSKFDSIADHALQLSTVAWLLMLKPEVFSENAWLAFTALGLNLLSLLVGIVKFKRIANLHLYLSKLAFLLFFIFTIHAFLFDRYSKILLVIACTGIILASLETIAVQLMRDQVDERIGSLLFSYIEEDHPLRKALRRIP
ncbi:MAG: CDP-alcohol phosphatidyltransferase family protein [Anaerolineales bacterium]|jgi:phosphatidylglycerophosphate synthase